jgi:hypothetical protein
LTLIAKGDQILDGSIKSINNPDIEMKNCTLGEICAGEINSNSVHYYSVEYSFDPSMVRHLICIRFFIWYLPSQERELNASGTARYC